MFLEALHITKSFPGVRALQDVDISIREGEIHAVVGENGAGKSTLMSILIGLTRPDSGTIRIDSREVVLHSPVDAQRMGISIVPQEINLVPMLSVMENVFLGLEPRALGGRLIDWRETERRTRELLDKVGAAIDPKAEIRDLSTAQRQLVQIARAFAFGARVLILDEPTASLTTRESDNLFRIIRSHQQSGGSAFYISHRLEEIKEIADRITVLRDGRKVAQLDARDASIQEMIGHMVGSRERPAAESRRAAPERSKVVLKVEGLSRHGEFSDVSFELHEGEILGIAGLVGAGRTELVKCIFGDTQAHSGSVWIDGTRTVNRSPQQGIRSGIAYVPEERRRLGLFPILSVAENMTLPILHRLAGAFGISRRRQAGLVTDYVSRLRIKCGDQRNPVRNLSGGNQQKVILARWLLRGCRILVLDEPTRGIDVNAKAEIHALLRKITEERISVILISSELEEVIANSDRIIVLHEGRLKGQLDPSVTTQEEIMRVCLT
jgi:ABC-type sugar transport system ATPase subunit